MDTIFDHFRHRSNPRKPLPDDLKAVRELYERSCGLLWYFSARTSLHRILDALDAKAEELELEGRR